jgi:hypothetical protein
MAAYFDVLDFIRVLLRDSRAKSVFGFIPKTVIGKSRFARVNAQ